MSTTTIERETLMSPDGAALNVYRSAPWRPVPTVALAGTFGIPASIFAPLIPQLHEAGLNVIGWETRGLPSRGGDLETLDVSLAAHVRDYRAVLARHDVRRPHLVGWSAGASLALKIASEAGQARSLTLVCGTYLSPNLRLSELVSNMRSMSEVRDTQALEEIYAVGFPAARSEVLAGRDADTVEVMGQRVSLAVAAAIRHPFASPENFVRYCALIRGFVHESCDTWLAAAAVPTLVVSGSADPISPVEHGLYISERLPSASSLMIPGGTHYLIHDHAAEIAGLIAQQVMLHQGGGELS